MAALGDGVKREDDDGPETSMSVTEMQDRPGNMVDRALEGERFRITRGVHKRTVCYIVGPADYRRFRELEQLATKKKSRVA